MITHPNYLGVIVPLAAVLAVAGFGYFVAKKSAGSAARKWVVGGLAGLVLALLVVADEIAGHWYLRHLCSTQPVGIEVYRQVKLPAD